MTSILTHNGTVTVKSLATGDHRTFSVSTQKDDAEFAPGERIVSLLTGPENTSDFTSFGFVKPDRIVVWRKKRGTEFDRFARLLERLESFESAEKVTVHFESTCRRCNRPLTTPESVESGIGPVCAGRE